MATLEKPHSDLTCHYDLFSQTVCLAKEAREQMDILLFHSNIYRVSWGECARLQENVPYVKVHRYNPKHLRISEVERLRR